MTELGRAVDRLTRRLHPEHIAVVDDQDEGRALVVRVLSSRADVRAFASPAELIAACRNGWQPDVVLLDVHLPGVRHEDWIDVIDRLARVVIYSDEDELPACLQGRPRLRKDELVAAATPTLVLDRIALGRALRRVRAALA